MCERSGCVTDKKTPGGAGRLCHRYRKDVVSQDWAERIGSFWMAVDEMPSKCVSLKGSHSRVTKLVLFRGLAFGGTTNTAACRLWLAAGTLGRQANEALPHEIGGHDESRCGGVLCPGHEPIKREHGVRHAK